MLKRIGVSILTAIAFLTAVAQKSTSYEIEKDYPLFLEKMKQELTYPMAWGNSAQTDFSEWRKMARTIVLDAMLAPPPVAKEYGMEVVAIEQRTGYEKFVSTFPVIPGFPLTCWFLRGKARFRLLCCYMIMVRIFR